MPRQLRSTQSEAEYYSINQVSQLGHCKSASPWLAIGPFDKSNFVLSGHHVRHDSYLHGVGASPYDTSQLGNNDIVMITNSPEILYRTLNTNSTTGLRSLMPGLESVMQNYTISMRYAAVNVYITTCSTAGLYPTQPPTQPTPPSAICTSTTPKIL